MSYHAHLQWIIMSLMNYPGSKILHNTLSFQRVTTSLNCHQFSNEPPHLQGVTRSSISHFIFIYKTPHIHWDTPSMSHHISNEPPYIQWTTTSHHISNEPPYIQWTTTSHHIFNEPQDLQWATTSSMSHKISNEPSCLNEPSDLQWTITYPMNIVRWLEISFYLKIGWESGKVIWVLGLYRRSPQIIC